MRAKRNLVASYSFIIINILINLFVVRLTVQHYGEQIFAFVVLAFSFIAYTETFNLGTYLSNRTQIPIRGKNASVYTVATIKFLSVIALVLLGLWSCFYFLAGDMLVRAISTESDPFVLENGKQLIGIAVVYGILKIPTSVVLSAFAGHDRVDTEKKYNTAQQLIKIFALVIAINLKLSVLLYFLSFTILGIVLLLGSNIHFYKSFISEKKETYLRYAKSISSSFILKNSFKFYVFSMASVVVWSTDNLLVSIFFNPKMLTDYNINFSIYNAAFLFITAIAGALIANYGNLIRDKEIDVLNFRINLSIYTTFVIALCIAFGGVLFSREIINLWVGEGHYIGIDLIIAFAIFGLTLSFSSVTNTLLALFANSKTIMAMTISEAILNFILSLILLKVIGVTGIAYATGIAALITVVIPGIILLAKKFKGELKIEFLPLIIQFMLCGISVLVFLNSGNVSLFHKVFGFIIYFTAVVLLTVLMKKDYLKSYSKIIKK
jgi:O-antigen/teichoic acid export membrane protein